MLYLICQRYKFESESQLVVVIYTGGITKRVKYNWGKNS